MVENDLPGSRDLLAALISNQAPVTGITGPPGAGKSTLINAITSEFLARPKVDGSPVKLAVLTVDPTSPFTHGSLLGDRLRMQDHFNNPNVFIRSLATRGALGGVSAKTIEVLDVLKCGGFDQILLETVGVGQSEVEVITMADTTVVVLVPEAGDEIQALKSGIMEIADVFVVNKGDRDGVDLFIAGIHKTLHERAASDWSVPVLKTIASQRLGISELVNELLKHQQQINVPRKNRLLAEQLFRLVQQEKMREISFEELQRILNTEALKSDFNIYRLAQKIANH